jgi:hypothetical protein
MQNSDPKKISAAKGKYQLERFVVVAPKQEYRHPARERSEKQ